MNITEKIKTFEDACRELGIDAEKWQAENRADRLDKDVLAYLKLRIIAQALNNGWKPSFAEDEYRYYPWFDLLAQGEIDGLNEEWKKSHRLWLFGGVSHYGSNCGLAFSFSRSAWSFANSSVSARLAVKTAKLAEYFGQQFIDIWADYVYWGQH